MDSHIGWTGKYKHNWDESYERVMAFLHCEETDRPVLFNSVPKPVSEQKGKKMTPATPEEAAQYDLDSTVQLHNTKWYLENTLFLAESVPFARTDFASLLGMLCVQAGGRIKYTPDTFTAWFEQEENLYERPLPELSTPCPQLDFVTGMIRRNHEAFGYDVVLGANAMLDPMTTLSLMRGTEQFCLDLIEREADVKRWLRRMGELHRKAISGYREARAVLGRREDYNWTGIWAPGDMDAVQCDVSTMLSPEMFNKYVLPEAEAEISFFDYAIWHLDGSEEFKHLDAILGIEGLNVIQYIDEKKRDPVMFAHIWEKIIKSGKSINFHCGKEYAPAITKALGRRGVSFTCGNIKTGEDMDWLLGELGKI
jgi:hypothetical protein